MRNSWIARSLKLVALIAELWPVYVCSGATTANPLIFPASREMTDAGSNFLLDDLPLFAGHRPLLPRPQEVHYGDGLLPVCSIHVELAGEADETGRFTARQLAGLLSSYCGKPIAISERPLPGRRIALRRTGASDPLPRPGEAAGPLSREAYSLIIHPDGGEIRARSSAGLFYGVQTVRQLVESGTAPATLPEVEIRDWPSLPYRGTMIDISHGPLLREDEIKRQIDFLAQWKANQYFLYSEASIELDGFPLLNPEGRFSKGQIRRIVQYALARHIDVIPIVEMYGHTHDLLRIEHYSPLGALPHAPEFNPANADVMKTLAEWVRQLSDLFPSPFVHIGFDETWQIEMVAKQVGGVAPSELFLKQLRGATRLWQAQGKTVMAWADGFVKYSGVIDHLPAGLIPVVWNRPTQPGPNKFLDPFVERGLPHFMESGVNNWHQIAIDFDGSFADVDAYVSAARASKAAGLINAVWLDSSFSPLRLALPAMAYGAIAPWQSVPVDRRAFLAEYAALTYPADVAGHVAAALDKINRSELSIEKVFGEDSFYEIWENPFDKARLQRSAAHRDTLRQTRLLAEDAETEILAALGKSGDAATLYPPLFAARMLDYSAYRYLDALEIVERWRQISVDFHLDRWWREFESEVPYQSHSRLVDLMDAITQLREFYRSAVWAPEYQPYRLGTTLGRFDAEYEYWRRLQSRFYNVGKNLAAKKGLPPLQSVVGER